LVFDALLFCWSLWNGLKIKLKFDGTAQSKSPPLWIFIGFLGTTSLFLVILRLISHPTKYRLGRHIPNPPMTKMVLFFVIALLCIASYSQTDSILYYKKALANMKESHNFTPKDSSYIRLLNLLSSKFKHIDTDTLAVLAKEALDLSESIDFEMGKLEALSHLAIFELINGNFEKSRQYNKQILQNLDVKKFPELGAKIYNVLGQTYFSLANHHESYKYFYESLLLAETTKNKDLIIRINSNLGNLFSLLEDYDEAFNFYEVALHSFNETDSSVTKAAVQANLGYLYMKKNDSTKALELLNRSLPILKKANVLEILPIVYMAFGDVYLNNNIFDKALDYFEKAKVYYLSSNDIMNKAYVLYGLGLSNLALNNLREAEDYLHQSVALYKFINFKTGLEQTSRSLYELNKKKNAIAQALYYLELAQRYSDSTFHEKGIRDISMLKAKTGFEREQIALQQKNEKEVAQQKKYVLWTGLGLALAVIIALLVILINKTGRKLNKELALQTINLSQQQEELNKINTNQDKLFSIVGHDLRAPIVSLKQLLGLALEDEEGIKHFYEFGPKLKKDVDHIHFTLDNLLNWGLTQMHGDASNPTEINIKQELLEIENFFRDALDTKRINVEQTVPDDLILIADLNHFTIIFRNLISNAIKFTPENGKIWLASYRKNKTTYITVKDNGIGMSTEVLHKIFKTAEHFTSFGTNDERGTGLGLVLCKEMAEKNTGHIDVDSELGKGTTFKVGFFQ